MSCDVLCPGRSKQCGTADGRIDVRIDGETAFSLVWGRWLADRAVCKDGLVSRLRGREEGSLAGCLFDQASLGRWPDAAEREDGEAAAGSYAHGISHQARHD